MSRVALYDVSSHHVSQLISEAFKYSHIVLASVTYNLGIYPAMHDFLMDMKALNLQNRTFALIENGSWAVKSGDLMRKIRQQRAEEHDGAQRAAQSRLPRWGRTRPLSWKRWRTRFWSLCSDRRGERKKEIGCRKALRLPAGETVFREMGRTSTIPRLSALFPKEAQRVRT